MSVKEAMRYGRLVADRAGGEQTALVTLARHIEHLERGLRDIATRNWARYPNHERHGCKTVENYALWILNSGDPPLVRAEQDPASGRWYVLDAAGERLHGPYLSDPTAGAGA